MLYLLVARFFGCKFRHFCDCVLINLFETYFFLVFFEYLEMFLKSYFPVENGKYVASTSYDVFFYLKKSCHVHEII